ncbi:galectin-1-like [Notamacropus eugenii]|uniref:galectin-1-like n=1 Tax=Notamacropus eugenii TaxID=9315 RepID=UPI003B673340
MGTKQRRVSELPDLLWLPCITCEQGEVTISALRLQVILRGPSAARRTEGEFLIVRYALNECAGEFLLDKLNIQPGMCVKIKGNILHNASGFKINLGKDEENIALHFNPRFNFLHGPSITVFSSKKEGVWDMEKRETVFPFRKNMTAEVSITFEGEQFRVRINDDHEVSFPNCLDLKQLDLLAVNGDFNVTSLAFD